MVNIHRIMSQGSTRPIRPRLNAFTSTPGVNRVQSFPGNFKSVQVAPFHGRVQLVLNNVVRHRFNRRQIVTSTSHYMSTNHLRCIHLSRFNRFMDQTFTRGFLNTNSISRAFIGQVSVIINFVHMLLMGIISFNVFLRVRPRLQHHGRRSQQVKRKRIPNPTSIQSPMDLLNNQKKDRSRSTTTLFQVN